jgi:hypothetical protein
VKIEHTFFRLICKTIIPLTVKDLLKEQIARKMA